MKNQYQHNTDGSTTIFHVNKLTGKILATYIDTEDFQKVSSIKDSWRIYKNNPDAKYRVRTTLDGKNIYLYRILLGADENQLVDHIDGDPLNNRKSNLRLATPSINAQNRRDKYLLPRNVTYNKRDNKYRVSFVVDGRRKSFGQYHSIEEAQRVAIEARKKYMPGAINWNVVKMWSCDQKTPGKPLYINVSKLHNSTWVVLSM